MMACRLAIIIPVYRGASELDSTLRALVRESLQGITVVIVVNGPDDGALGIAELMLPQLQSSGIDAKIRHLAQPSRPQALSAGDHLAPQDSHRLYLDQDAILSPGGTGRILSALEGGAHFVAAPAHWRGGTLPVRAAMQAWNAMPYVRNSPATAGMFALSNAARQRWADWPETVPDDKFARLNVPPEDRCRLEDVSYSVAAPRDVQALIQARRRYARNNAAIRQQYPLLAQGDLGRGLANLIGAGWRHMPGAAILGLAHLVGRMRD